MTKTAYTTDKNHVASTIDARGKVARQTVNLTNDTVTNTTMELSRKVQSENWSAMLKMQRSNTRIG